MCGVVLCSGLRELPFLTRPDYAGVWRGFSFMMKIGGDFQRPWGSREFLWGNGFCHRGTEAQRKLL